MEVAWRRLVAGRGSEKGSDSGYTLKVDHSAFVDGLDVA